MKYAAAAVALLVALCMGVWLRSGGVDDAGTPVSTDDVPAAYRAIVVEEYGDADRMTIGTRPMPSVVGPTDVIVRVAYAGVNPVDYKLRRGNLQLVMSLPLPFTPGFDFSGTVAAVGSDVAKLRVGDKVFGRQPSLRRGGTYAEFVLVTEQDVVVTPPGVTQEAAGGASVTGLSAWEAAVLAGLHTRPQGTRVLVNGASGGVGLMAVQVAAAFGAKVTGVCSTRNFELVKQHGAKQVLDYHLVTPEHMLGMARHKYDVIIDCVGGDELWEAAHDHLATGGAYVTLVGPQQHAGSTYVGILDGVASIIHVLGRKLHAAVWGGPTYDVVLSLDNRNLAAVAEMLSSGAVTVHVGHRFPLHDVAGAHAVSESHRAQGKIVLKVWDEGRTGEDAKRAEQPTQQT